jgi:hypothetical protein
MTGETSNGMEEKAGERLDNRVIPVMREAVLTVQMVLFGVLRERLAERYGSWPADSYSRLIGCLINDIFGTPAREEEAVRFARKHMDLVEEELRRLAGTVPELLPILTDALRMQTLCDHEERVNSLPTLLRARAVGILQEERNMPMPSTFMIAVRRLGAEYGLVNPVQPPPDTPGQDSA